MINTLSDDIDKVPWCKSRLCTAMCSQIANNNRRGFCCGILKKPYAKTPKNDIVKFCFVDYTIKHGFTVIGYVMTPAEALLGASALAWTYERYVDSYLEPLKKTSNIAANSDVERHGKNTRQ